MWCSQSVPDALTSSKIQITGKTYFFSRFPSVWKKYPFFSSPFSQISISAAAPQCSLRCEWTDLLLSRLRATVSWLKPTPLTTFSSYPYWGNCALKGPVARFPHNPAKIAVNSILWSYEIVHPVIKVSIIYSPSCCFSQTAQAKC